MNITISNNTISATIKTFGAELVQLSKGTQNYIWNIDENYWNKTSPILFPIVGRLKNDTYNLNGKDFSLPRHGFARDYEFEVVQQTSESVSFLLSSSEKTLENYPFHFDFLYHYEIKDNGLEISFEIINKNNTEMPFSVGAHPAFLLENPIEAYQLQFEKDELLATYHLQNDLFNGESSVVESQSGSIKLHDALFENDALVFKNLESKTITLCQNEKPVLKIYFKDFPYLGIWKKMNAPFICLEPWLGLADSHTHNGNIFEKEGISILQPNSSVKLGYKIELP